MDFTLKLIVKIGPLSQRKQQQKCESFHLTQVLCQVGKFILHIEVLKCKGESEKEKE